MTKLKTLKDIEVHEADEEDLTNNVEWFKQELKAEAIKWVKNGDRKLRQLIPSASNYKECVIGIITTQETFKTFFNITEEDLVPIEKKRVGTNILNPLEKRELVPIK